MTRETGSAAVLRRFPTARLLWQLSAKKGYVSPFTLSAYAIGGRVVLLQEFGEDGGFSWDVYVAACDSGEIKATLDAVAARVGSNV